MRDICKRFYEETNNDFLCQMKVQITLSVKKAINIMRMDCTHVLLRSKLFRDSEPILVTEPIICIVTRNVKHFA